MCVTEMLNSYSNVVVTVKSPQKATGDSYVTRYIAESNLDHNREGEEPRLLFTEEKDHLGWVEANELLSLGGKPPAKCDIIHLVVLFTMEDYLSLAPSEEDRLKAVRSTTRTVMQTVQDVANTAKSKMGRRNPP